MSNRRIYMSNRTIAAMVWAMLLAVNAVAASAHAGVQQERMKQCNVEAKAKSLAGSARKEFMKSCLSTHETAGHALNSQQQKMKVCSADAKSKGLKGAERRKFMSVCLEKG